MSDFRTARSIFSPELEQNPKIRDALFALTHAEVGGQGPQAQQAFMETVFNRAAARKKTLADTIYDRGYFPAITHQRMARGVPQQLSQVYSDLYKKVADGSNVSNWATGNASGTVKFNGGPETFAAAGERFGVEGPDRKWAESLGFGTSNGLPKLSPLQPDGSNAGVANAAPPMQQAATPQPGAQPNMASPYSGPSPDDVAMQRKIAMALMGQATSTDPVGHWTQALARVVQGGVGGMNQDAARAGDKGLREHGNQALLAAVNGGDPKAAIAGLLSSPNTNEMGQKLAGGVLQSQLAPKYNFMAAGDNLFRTNSSTGVAESVAAGTSKPTTDVQNYKAYVAETVGAGQKPMPFIDYQKSLKQAGATAITNEMRGENAESKGLGEGAAKRANDTIDRARAASGTLRRLSDLTARLDTIQSGKLAPAKANMGAWAKAIGLPDEALTTLGIDPKMPGNVQSINAITSRMVVDMIGAGGFPANNFSDADREFLVSTIPRISNEPRGNALIIEAAKRVAQLDVEKAKAQQSWRATNKNKSLDEFELEWADKTAKQDLLGDLRREAQALIGATGAKPVNGFPAPAVELLRAKPTPEARKQFDDVFGVGAAARALGGN